jgi:hypothetical protein
MCAAIQASLVGPRVERQRSILLSTAHVACLRAQLKTGAGSEKKLTLDWPMISDDV